MKDEEGEVRMGKKKKKAKEVEPTKNDGSESYSSFDEYLDFDVAVSTLQDCCSSLLPKIRSQLDDTSIDKKALRELVLMLDYVVSETKDRILYLTPQTCPNEDDEIKGKAQSRLNEIISRIKNVLELKRPYEEDDDGKRRVEKRILEERLMECEERMEAIAERIRKLEEEERAAYDDDDWEDRRRREEEEEDRRREEEEEDRRREEEDEE